MAELAREALNDAFGHLLSPEMRDTVLRVAEPGQPGEVFDLFDYVRWHLLPADENARREDAFVNLKLFASTRTGNTADVLAEHHAVSQGR